MDNPKLVTYIEFTGVPGSGKSTVAALVIDNLVQRGIRVVTQGSMGRRVFPDNVAVEPIRGGWKKMTKWNRTVTYLSLHIRYCRVAASLYAYLLVNGKVDNLRLRACRSILLVLNRLGNAVEVVAKGEADVILFDQGVTSYLREAVSARSTINERVFAWIVRSLLAYLDDLRWVGVNIEVEASTAAVRIHQRMADLGRFDRMSLEDSERLLEKEGRFTRPVLKQMEEHRLVSHVVHCAGHDRTESIAKQVEEEIMTSLNASYPLPRAACPVPEL